VWTGEPSYRGTVPPQIQSNKMLLSCVLLIFLATVSASPLLHNQDKSADSLATVDRNFDLFGDTVNVSENVQEFLDGDVDESRLLTSGSAGEYTLVSIPWAQGTSLTFNDTAASTLSTLGNAALLVGGLYLLSGFPGAALSDPFGISRRFGQPALPGPPPPRFKRIQHKTGKQGKGSVSKRKSVKSKRRPIERRGPAPVMAKPTTQQSAQERQLLRPSRLPSLPTLRPLRPLNFRMPKLPSLRIPSLPNLRRPSFPQLNNPFRRPAARPRPVQQSSRPRPASTAPASPVSPSNAPPAPSFRPSAPKSPVFLVTDSAPIVPVQNSPSQTAPLTLPQLRPATPSDFGGAFENDPFSEFQSSDFGSDASFRELINQQFGESFDLQRLPNSRADKNQNE